MWMGMGAGDETRAAREPERRQTTTATGKKERMGWDGTVRIGTD